MSTTPIQELHWKYNRLLKPMYQRASDIRKQIESKGCPLSRQLVQEQTQSHY